MAEKTNFAAQESSSHIGTRVDECQLCGGRDLASVLFLGYVPPLNKIYPVRERLGEEPSAPAEVLRCNACGLVQLGCVLNEGVLFPLDYPYESGTTRVQRDNFGDLVRESTEVLGLRPEELVVDVGSNNGTLLALFQDEGARVLGVEPTRTADKARARGIATIGRFLRVDVAREIVRENGAPRLVTATNLLAHVGDVHELVAAIAELVGDAGALIAEVQDLGGVVSQLQYDSFYHEHIRYYSLATLARLFAEHGLEVFRAKRIPTHGGSLRVYAARKGTRALHPSVSEILREEAPLVGTLDALEGFAKRALSAKLRLQTLLADAVSRGQKIFAVGAASRASMLARYVGLDERMVRCVLEIPGSPKIGSYLPGTKIPIEPETKLWEEQPDFALLFSWHVAADLMPKLTARGFRGGYIVPLPEPRILPS